MTGDSDHQTRPVDTQGGAVLRVYLVDDHEIVREGLQRVLEDDPGIRIVGQAGTVQQARRELLELRPDVAVIDGRLPDGSGVELCQLVRDELAGSRSLLLTSYDDDALILDAITAGATGVLLKQVGGTDFVSAVRQVARGESTLHPVVTRRLMDRLALALRAPDRVGSPGSGGPRAVSVSPPGGGGDGGADGAEPLPSNGSPIEPAAALERLTPRERMVLQLIGAGLPNRAIATELGVSEKTVKNHVTHLLSKLGVQRRTQAALLAARVAPLDPADSDL